MSGLIVRAEVDRLDHGAVDAVDRDDDALLAMRALDDELVRGRSSSCSWASYSRRMNSMIATRIGISSRTSQAPSKNFTLVTTTATIPVATQPNALIARRRRQPGDLLAQPVADHARLADREVDEDADRVERDQGVRLAA